MAGLVEATSRHTVTVPSIAKAIDDGDRASVEGWAGQVPEATERARQLAILSPARFRALGEILTIESGAAIVSGVNARLGARLLEYVPDDTTLSILDTVGSDRASLLLRAMSEGRRDTLLERLPQSVGDPVRALMQWPIDSAAGHMVPEALTAPGRATVRDAIEHARSSSHRLRNDDQVGAYVYVLDESGQLSGAVGFRELAMADPNALVEDLVSAPVTSVAPDDDAETAAQLLLDRGLVAVPVVDTSGRVLGVVTESVAHEVALVQAATVAARQGGTEPLEVPYLQASPWLLWRKRIVWLLVLFAAEAYTGTVLRAFAEEMEAVVALAFFIPLLIGTGGNTGTQITSTLVRALGTGEVRLRDTPRILRKELSTGVLIALSMGAVAILRAWMLGVGFEVTATVAVTIAAIVLWSSLVSAVLPPLLHKLKIDPAVVSAPLIATIVDGTGLMIYFMTAHLMLSQLNGL